MSESKLTKEPDLPPLRFGVCSAACAVRAMGSGRSRNEAQAMKFSMRADPRYIEACRESECIQVLQPHVAEIWRLTYVTPPPTSPRTFVVLVLSRELVSSPHGERCFMNSECCFDARLRCLPRLLRGDWIGVDRACALLFGRHILYHLTSCMANH